MGANRTSYRKGNMSGRRFTSELSIRINAENPQPQEHYKRIGSMGGKMNKGRRYNAESGFVLVDGRWRNPRKL